MQSSAPVFPYAAAASHPAAAAPPYPTIYYPPPPLPPPTQQQQQHQHQHQHQQQYPYSHHPPPYAPATASAAVPAPPRTFPQQQNDYNYLHNNAASPHAHDPHAPAHLQNWANSRPVSMPPTALPGLGAPHVQGSLAPSHSWLPSDIHPQASSLAQPPSPAQLYPPVPLSEAAAAQASLAQDPSDKEEGELSDRDFAKVPPLPPHIPLSRPPPGPRKPAAQRRDPPRGKGQRQPATTVTNSSARANTLNTDKTRKPSPGYGSYRPSVNRPRQRGSPDYSPMAQDPTSAPMPLSTPAVQADTPIQGITHDYLDAERAKVKAFVAAWQRNGFTYDQLVAEGLDASILQAIYDELGIDIRSGRQSNGLQAQSVPPQEAAQQHADQAKVHQKPSNSVPIEKSTQPKAPVTYHQAKGPQGSLTAPTDKPTHPLHSAAPTIQVSAPTRASISPKLTKAPQPTPMDRESYIARLMAAKSKKSSSEPDRISAPASTHADKSSKVTLIDQTASPPRPNPQDPHASFTSPNNSSGAPPALQDPSSSDSPLAQAATAAKRKAQTELARKRMEALTSARLKAAQTSAPRPPSPASTSSSVDQPASAAQHEEDAVKSDTPVHAQTDTEPGHDHDLTLSENRSRIPGLFMTAPVAERPYKLPLLATDESASTEAKSLPPSFIFNTAPASVRKRPLASDFNDDVQNFPVNKRPFGVSRRAEDDESIIIEASDDENELPEEMSTTDRDPPEAHAVDAVNSTASILVKPSEALSSSPHTIQNPTLTLRKDLAKNSNRPSSAQGHGTPRDQDYLQHQKDILAMKLKIAKLEQQRKVKSRSGNPATPGTPMSELQSATQNSPHLGDRLAEISREASITAASEQSHPPSDAGEWPLETSLQPPGSSLPARPSPTFDQASGTLAESKPTLSLNWKNRRRTEIQSGIPALEASFADDNRQLEALREQMKRLEDNMKRKQQDKERLVKELESLGVDTEGMAHSDLQATKDELTARMDQDNEMDRDNEMDEDSEAKSETAHDIPGTETKISRRKMKGKKNVSGSVNRRKKAIKKALARSASASVSSIADSNESSASSMSISSPEETIPIAQQNDVPSEEPTAERSDLDLEESHQVDYAPGPLKPVAESPKPSASTAQITDPGDSDSARASSEKSSDSRDDSVVVLSTRLSVPHGPGEITQQAKSPGFPSDQSGSSGQASPEKTEHELSEGEIPESDSDKARDEPRTDLHLPNQSEEYMPPDSTAVSASASNQDPVSPTLDDDGYEPAEIDDIPVLRGSRHSAEIVSDDSGEYEPPDAQEETDDLNYDTKESGDEYDPDEDFAAAANSSTRGTDPSISRLPSISADAKNQVSESVGDANTADNLPTEPKRAKSTSDLPEEDRFVPYQSALKTFKSFRFHPEFGSSVSGGFRSNTFTHSIDPQKPWCSFEAAGGVCNDEKCDAQHFRSMRIQDDDMIRQVGMSNPGETEEERFNFTEGLKAVLLELKQRSVADPEAVASEIAAYRRRFLKDPLRIL